MADYTKRLQILLTEEQYDFIKKTAESQSLSVAELIRRAVEQYYRPRISLKELSALEALGKESLFEWTEDLCQKVFVSPVR